MKTGIELIVEERKEQIEKHNWSKEHDQSHNNNELKMAALFAIAPYDILYENMPIEYILEKGWETFKSKVSNKGEIDRLKIAGALIAAEIDRLSKING